MQEQVVKMLAERKMTITAAESCTAGAFCSAIASVPGASDVLREGFVTYCNEAKIRTLGVSPETIKKFTEVSKECAQEMALGAKKLARADAAVSITGYAGPSGNPRGLVYICCIVGDRINIKQNMFEGDRECVRKCSVETALCLVRDMLLD